MRGHLDIMSVMHPRLRKNPLGDAATRRIPIYLPPSYAPSVHRHFPVCYFLAGFSGTGETHLNVAAWSETLPERLDRLIRTGRIPAIIAARGAQAAARLLFGGRSAG